jgi:hypothetical protein
MAIGRKPEQVAKRTLILGAMAFRSSLEVTNHPRVHEFSRRLLPWLNDIGCGDELDPIEREELETPLGRLSECQKKDVSWAGESAAFFRWMLKLGEPLDENSRAEQSDLPVALCILKPEASEILRTAALRNGTEIVNTCRQFVLILSMLRESRVGPPASDIIRRLCLKELSEVGAAATEDDVRRASEAVGRMTPQVRGQMVFPYFVRKHAALWFLGDRTSYFGDIECGDIVTDARPETQTCPASGAANSEPA